MVATSKGLKRFLRLLITLINKKQWNNYFIEQAMVVQ